MFCFKVKASFQLRKEVLHPLLYRHFISLSSSTSCLSLRRSYWKPSTTATTTTSCNKKCKTTRITRQDYPVILSTNSNSISSSRFLHFCRFNFKKMENQQQLSSPSSLKFSGDAVDTSNSNSSKKPIDEVVGDKLLLQPEPPLKMDVDNIEMETEQLSCPSSKVLEEDVKSKSSLSDEFPCSSSVNSSIDDCGEISQSNNGGVDLEYNSTSTTALDDIEIDNLKKTEPTTTTTTATAADNGEDKPVSKKSLKRQARGQKYKELKKRRKAELVAKTGKVESGFSIGEFDESSYYFENGLRKVYPYPFVFATHAKGRWVGRTLKNVLAQEFGFDKPEDVDRAFDEGRIYVNRQLVDNSYTVKSCDYISHQIHRHENPVTDGDLEIVADTADVVVINKPSSMPCHPCGRYRYNSVLFILGKEMGYANLRNIYRLDRLTSGVLIMGKTAEATKLLEDQVMNRQVQKEYVCRVIGEFPSEPVTVDQPLGALSNKLRLQIVSPTGKSSQTTFSRLSYNGVSSVVRCVPHTGRTHQIRVHLQYIGHPIINDVFYNSEAWGPNLGKGGLYNVPKDKVCELIMRRHHRTQWDGGENPHFEQRLQEMKKDESAKTNASTNTKTNANNTNNSLSSPTNDTDTEAVHKNTNLENSGDTTTTADDCHKNHDSASTTTKTTPDRVISPSSTVDNNSRRPGFDWAKWKVEETCDFCRNTTLEPRPKDLVMFLHAWKYKGPGWAYETKLPDWAEEDWNQEDLFMMESPLEIELPIEEVTNTDQSGTTTSTSNSK